MSNSKKDSTIYYDKLLAHMEESYKNGYYLETITCSYAVLENRSKRLLEHLGIKTYQEKPDGTRKDFMLSEKRKLVDKIIYSSSHLIDLPELVDQSNKNILANHLKYRLTEKNFLFDKNSDNTNNFNVKELFNRNDAGEIVRFAEERNVLIHQLAQYDQIDFNQEDFKQLAEDGVRISKLLAREVSKLKKLLKNFPSD